MQFLAWPPPASRVGPAPTQISLQPCAAAASAYPYSQLHRADTDNTLWELNLREGLLFHDDTPVLARDCVASILRWARRDPYGSALLARAEEIGKIVHELELAGARLEQGACRRFLRLSECHQRPPR